MSGGGADAGCAGSSHGGIRRGSAFGGSLFRLTLLSASAALAHPTAAQEVAWVVDEACITFETRNAGLPVRGSFEGVQAEIAFDPAWPETGELVASLDPSTIETGIAMRDRHLARRGWFEVERYPRVVMRSVGLRREGDGYVGSFLLSIRDVEREVEVPFSFEESGGTARISGALTIDRLDYGVGKRSPILANDVTVHVALDLVRASLRPGGNLAPGTN